MSAPLKSRAFASPFSLFLTSTLPCHFLMTFHTLETEAGSTLMSFYSLCFVASFSDAQLLGGASRCWNEGLTTTPGDDVSIVLYLVFVV